MLDSTLKFSNKSNTNFSESKLDKAALEFINSLFADCVGATLFYQSFADADLAPIPGKVTPWKSEKDFSWLPQKFAMPPCSPVIDFLITVLIP
jgi:hypothetical protein